MATAAVDVLPVPRKRHRTSSQEANTDRTPAPSDLHRPASATVTAPTEDQVITFVVGRDTSVAVSLLLLYTAAMCGRDRSSHDAAQRRRRNNNTVAPGPDGDDFTSLFELAVDPNTARDEQGRIRLDVDEDMFRGAINALRGYKAFLRPPVITCPASVSPTVRNPTVTIHGTWRSSPGAAAAGQSISLPAPTFNQAGSRCDGVFGYSDHNIKSARKLQWNQISATSSVLGLDAAVQRNSEWLQTEVNVALVEECPWLVLSRLQALGLQVPQQHPTSVACPLKAPLPATVPPPPCTVLSHRVLPTSNTTAALAVKMSELLTRGVRARHAFFSAVPTGFGFDASSTTVVKVFAPTEDRVARQKTLSAAALPDSPWQAPYSAMSASFAVDDHEFVGLGVVPVTLSTYRCLKRALQEASKKCSDWSTSRTSAMDSLHGHFPHGYVTPEESMALPMCNPWDIIPVFASLPGVIMYYMNGIVLQTVPRETLIRCNLNMMVDGGWSSAAASAPGDGLPTRGSPPSPPTSDTRLTTTTASVSTRSYRSIVVSREENPDVIAALFTSAGMGKSIPRRFTTMTSILAEQQLRREPGGMHAAAAGPLGGRLGSYSVPQAQFLPPAAISFTSRPHQIHCIRTDTGAPFGFLKEPNAQSIHGMWARPGTAPIITVRTCYRSGYVGFYVNGYNVHLARFAPLPPVTAPSSYNQEDGDEGLEVDADTRAAAPTGTAAAAHYGDNDDDDDDDDPVDGPTEGDDEEDDSSALPPGEESDTDEFSDLDASEEDEKGPSMHLVVVIYRKHSAIRLLTPNTTTPFKDSAASYRGDPSGEYA